MMYAGSDQHTVRQTWKLHTDPRRPARGLHLSTCRKDAKAPKGWTKAVVGYCPAFENELSKLAKEKAHAVMHGKRERAKKSGVAQKGLKSGADSSMSCPVLAAIGTRTRTTAGSSGPSAAPEVRHFTRKYLVDRDQCCSVPLLLCRVCAIYKPLTCTLLSYIICTAVLTVESTCTRLLYTLGELLQ